MLVSSVKNGLKEYVGKEIENRLADARRDAFCANWQQMKANYEDNVDGQLLDYQILVCDETEGWLYSEDWQQTNYKKGSRPELEKTVNQIIENKETEREKVLSIMSFCRDLYKKNDGYLLFYGGTEEELIKKGEQLCECVSRLMVALCEIIDIPARIITHVAGGHLTCEVFIENKWCYFDTRAGVFFLTKQGDIASVWELLSHPEIMDSQPDWVKEYVSPRWTWEQRQKKCKEMFFSPYEVNTVKPYSLADCEIFNYEWIKKSDFAKNGVNTIAYEYQVSSAECFGKKATPKTPRFLFTLSENEVITKPVKVVALSDGFVLHPAGVRFFVDDDFVWESEKCIGPDFVHITCEGRYALFGEGGLFDPSNFEEGSHTLKVCDINNPDYFSQIKVVVKHV